MSSPLIKETVIGTTGGPAGDGYSRVFVPDTYQNPFNIGIGCVLVSGSATFSVQHTFDDVLSPTFTPASATWFTNSGINGATASANGNYAYPVTGIRLYVSVGTGTVSITIAQAGTR